MLLVVSAPISCRLSLGHSKIILATSYRSHYLPFYSLFLLVITVVSSCRSHNSPFYHLGFLIITVAISYRSQSVTVLSLGVLNNYSCNKLPFLWVTDLSFNVAIIIRPTSYRSHLVPFYHLGFLIISVASGYLIHLVTVLQLKVLMITVSNNF